MRVAVSTRADGSMGFTGAPYPDAVRAARRAFLAAAGLDAAAAVAVRQVHGSRILLAGPGDRGRGGPDPAAVLGEADGIATHEAGLPLLVLSADCVVGAVADRNGRAVGVFHAGWRGVLAGAPAAAVEAVARLASLPAGVRGDFRAVLGPSIGPCCCEVGEEIPRRFLRRFGDAARAWFRTGRTGKPHLDLPGAVLAALEAAGVPVEGVRGAGCTRCGVDWFSHRRGDAGRQALVAVRADPDPSSRDSTA